MSRQRLLRLALPLSAIVCLLVAGLVFVPRLVLASAPSKASSFTTQARMGFAAGDDWEPSISADRYNHVYLLYKHYDVAGQTTCPSCDQHLLVQVSNDNGKTWSAPSAIDPEATKGGQFDPQIVVDPVDGKTVWVSFLQNNKSSIAVMKSTDFGQTWSGPTIVENLQRATDKDELAVHGQTIAVAFNAVQKIYAAISHDGGRSFSASRPVLDVGPPYFGGTGAVPGIGRVFGFPQVAVAPESSRPARRRSAARLYASWTDYRNGDIDVFVSSSDDDGRSWAAAVRVNSDSLHNGRDQFLQWMTVDPVTGDVYVQFYDRGADPENRLTSMTLARSTDGGRHFTSYRWSDEPFEGRGAFLGDYTWLTAFDGQVYGAWAETAPPTDSTTTAGTPARTRTVMKVGTARFARSSASVRQEESTRRPTTLPAPAHPR